MTVRGEYSDDAWRELGRAVRARRHEMGIPTQRAAAERTGTSQNTWQRLESGAQVSMTSLTEVASCLQWGEAVPAAILRGESAPVGDGLADAAPNDWPALARAVKDRRLELGIMTQREAADRAGIHVNTWNKVETGSPVKLASLGALAGVLRWSRAAVMALLRDGSLPTGFEEAEPKVALPRPPALLFLATDRTRHQVDSDRWSVESLSPRDVAILKALLGHVSARLDSAGPQDRTEQDHNAKEIPTHG